MSTSGSTRCGTKHLPFLYWFQKYSIDGVPEWETPAVDQTALIPWGLERHFRRTGDLDFVTSVWPMIEQACKVCCGDSGGHPGLRLLEDLNLISSAGSRDQHFGAFLYSNACVVAGLRAAARLAEKLGHDELKRAVERLRRPDLERRDPADDRHQPGQEPRSHRPGDRPIPVRLGGLQAARASGPTTPTCWSSIRPRLTSLRLSLAVPFGLLPASDPRLLRTAEAILRAHEAQKGDPNVLSQSIYEPAGFRSRAAREPILTTSPARRLSGWPGS